MDSRAQSSDLVNLFGLELQQLGLSRRASGPSSQLEDTCATEGHERRR